MEKIFPELVFAPDALREYYGVNYVGMIPVLVEAVKEQQILIENQQKEWQQETEILQFIIEALQQKMESLEEALIKCCNNNSNNLDETNTIQEFNLFDPADAMKVYQNVPNPFNEVTIIQCYIPQSIQKAELCVYNMQGVQIKCLTVSERGMVNVQIQAGQLPAGVYTYLLIGNGKTSDAKQMILTK